jgi:hypothetical protein
MTRVLASRGVCGVCVHCVLLLYGGLRSRMHSESCAWCASFAWGRRRKWRAPAAPTAEPPKAKRREAEHRTG